MDKVQALHAIKDFLKREGDGSLIVNTDDKTVKWVSDANLINHGPYVIAEAYGTNYECDCGEYYSDDCEACAEMVDHLLEKVEEASTGPQTKSIEQILEHIDKVTEGKLEFQTNIQYFNEVNEMIELYDVTYGHIVEGSPEHFDIAKLHDPFIVYDFDLCEFTFLTKFDDESVQRFINKILAQ